MLDQKKGVQKHRPEPWVWGEFFYVTKNQGKRRKRDKRKKGVRGKERKDAGLSGKKDPHPEVHCRWRICWGKDRRENGRKATRRRR